MSHRIDTHVQDVRKFSRLLNERCVVHDENLRIRQTNIVISSIQYFSVEAVSDQIGTYTTTHTNHHHQGTIAACVFELVERTLQYEVPAHGL